MTLVSNKRQMAIALVLVLVSSTIAIINAPEAEG
jgi:hypothetical protein